MDFAKKFSVYSQLKRVIDSETDRRQRDRQTEKRSH